MGTKIQEPLCITTSPDFANSIEEVLTDPNFKHPIFELKEVVLKQGVIFPYANVYITAKREYTPEELFWFGFSCTNKNHFSK